MVSKAKVRSEWKAGYPKDLAVRATASRHASQIIRTQPDFVKAISVGIYYPLSWELDLLSLWEDRPEAVCFPRVEGERLVFYQVEHLSELASGYHGILEPPAVSRLRVERWKPDDLVLVPGLGFDRVGARVGSGKGFYDRFLSSSAAKRWGVGYHAQFSQGAALAQDPLDVRMLAIVTEQGLFQVE